MSNQRFSITPAAAAIDQNITDSIFRTLAVIGIYGDRNGWCWPSQKTLADHRGVSRQTINTHIKILIDSGYLNIQPRYDEETGAQKSNMMQVKLDREYDDLTPPVKSKALHPPSSPEFDTPHQVIDFTHNDPLNDPKEQKNIYSGSLNFRQMEYLPDDVLSVRTALVAIVQDQLWEPTETRFNEAAYLLYEQNSTVEDIRGFAEWWKANGHYNGKPALKSVIGKWKQYKQPVTAVSQDPEVEAVMVDGELKFKVVNNGHNR